MAAAPMEGTAPGGSPLDSPAPLAESTANPSVPRPRSRKAEPYTRLVDQPASEPSPSHLQGFDIASPQDTNPASTVQQQPQSSGKAEAVVSVVTTAKAAPPPSRVALREVRQLLCLGWPQSISNLLNFAPRLLVLAAVGHSCSGTSVAATGVGIMYSNFSGTMVLKGTAFGATPLLSQAYGAGNFLRVGQLLHRMLLVHLLLIVCVTLPLSSVAEMVLRSSGQPAAISREAQLFIWWRLCSMPMVALTQDLTNFLVAQRCVRTPMISNLAGSLAQCIFAPWLISHLGFVGAPIAMFLVEAAQALTLFIACPFLLPHAAASWPRWLQPSAWAAALRGWGELVFFGLPAALMVCSEWLGWECTLLLAGQLCPVEDPEGAGPPVECAEVEAVPIATTLLVSQFLFTFGVGLAACNRVGNLLGAGKALEARCCAMVAILLIFCIATSLATVMMFARHTLASFFVDDPEVVNLTSQLMIFTITYAALANLGPGCSQQIFFGVGVGLRIPAAINSVCFFVIGIPLGSFVAFRLGAGVLGLWAGLDTALALLLIGQYTYMWHTIDWKEAALVARKTALEHSSSQSLHGDMESVVEHSKTDLPTVRAEETVGDA